jgi:hypothetical protein
MRRLVLLVPVCLALLSGAALAQNTTPLSGPWIGDNNFALKTGGVVGINQPNMAVNLSKWTTQIHQNTQTGACYGAGASRVLCTSDQNHDLIADHSTIQSQDASLISFVTVGGSATATDVVGLDWRIASVLYQIRYTVQPGDTTSTIATNLAACINAGGAANCTVTAGFLNALLAFHDANGFGYQPRAGVSFGATTKVGFDQPWAASGNSVVTSLSGGASETLTLSSNDILDNGPYMATSRYVPGRLPVAGDQLGTFYFQGQSAPNSGIDTVYGAILPRVLVQDPTNPQGELLINTADGGSVKNHSPKIYVGNGVSFASSTGTNCGYPGLGSVNVCGFLQVQTRATFGTLTPGGTDNVLIAVGGVNVSGILTAVEFAGAGGTTPGIAIGTDNFGNRGTIAGLRYNHSSFNDIGFQTQSTVPQMVLKTTGILTLGAGQPFTWSQSSNDASATVDTGISRTAAGAMAVGNGTQGDTSGSLALQTIPQEKELQVTKTSNYTIQASDSNTFFDNFGAGGEVDFTLPAYAAGLRYCFGVIAAQTVKVIAPTLNKIAIGASNSGFAGNISANAPYSVVCLHATTTGDQWAAKSATGTWTVN